MGKQMTNSKEFIESLKRIRAQKERKYNKVGEWVNTRKEAPFTYEEKDLKFILK